MSDILGVLEEEEPEQIDVQGDQIRGVGGLASCLSWVLAETGIYKEVHRRA